MVKCVLSTCAYINFIISTATIPPIEFARIEVITGPHSVEISWVTPYIVLDRETYTVRYSTDSSLQNSSKVVIEANNEFTTNQKFSVNISGLIPFTKYYYNVQANNSAGNTSTDVMTFTTNQTGMSTKIIDYIIHSNVV